MATTKRKVPKTKGKPIVRNRIENRDNYRRWPWTSFLVLGISAGSIFFMAGSPTGISESTGVSFYLSIIFLSLGAAMLLPSVIVVLILLWYCFLNAIGTKIPERCQCLNCFVMCNKKIAQSSNFYNQPTGRKGVPTQQQVPPSVWTVEGEFKNMTSRDQMTSSAAERGDRLRFDSNNNDTHSETDGEDGIVVINEQVSPGGASPQDPARHTQNPQVGYFQDSNHQKGYPQMGNPQEGQSQKGYPQGRRYPADSRPTTPQQRRIELQRDSFTVHRNPAFIPDGHTNKEREVSSEASVHRIIASPDKRLNNSSDNRFNNSSDNRLNNSSDNRLNNSSDDRFIESSVHRPVRNKRRKYRTRHVSDGWEDHLMKEEPYLPSHQEGPCPTSHIHHQEGPYPPNHIHQGKEFIPPNHSPKTNPGVPSPQKPSKRNLPVSSPRYRHPSDRDSTSNASERNSAMISNSDRIPLVHVHPPSGDTPRTNSSEGRANQEEGQDSNGFQNRRNQRNMGSDRRNKRYKYPDSDTGHSTDKVSVSSQQGVYLSPSVHNARRSKPPGGNFKQQNGHVPRSSSPRMDDTLSAKRVRHQERGPSFGGGKPPTGRRKPFRIPLIARNPLPGTTPDKTVFPEKITLILNKPPSSPKGINAVERTRKNGTVVFGNSVPHPDGRTRVQGKRRPDWSPAQKHHVVSDPWTGSKPQDFRLGRPRLPVQEGDSEDEEGYCSSSSSWIGIPWSTYKLPPGFLDPDKSELSV